MRWINVLLIFTAVFYSIFFLSDKVTPISDFWMRSMEPTLYRSDEGIFLKTFYLMKSNLNYYDSYQIATEGEFAHRKLTADVFLWRMPTVFYVWFLFAQNGFQILLLFWVLTAFFIAAGFLLLKKLGGTSIALLGVVLALPYFSGGLWYKTAFLFTEWWAMFFLVFGLCFLIYKKYPIAWVLLLFSAAIRELVIVVFVFFLLYSVLARKLRLFFFTLILAFICIFSLHFLFVTSRFAQSSILGGLNLSSKSVHFFDYSTFQKMLAFSFWNYPLARFRIHQVLFVLSFLGLISFVARKKVDDRIFLYLAGWSNVLILPFLTRGNNDYWGILFVPILLLTIPLTFGNVYFFFKRT